MNEKLSKIYKVASRLHHVSSLNKFDRLIDGYLQNPTDEVLEQLEKAVRLLSIKEHGHVPVKA